MDAFNSQTHAQDDPDRNNAPTAAGESDRQSPALQELNDQLDQARAELADLLFEIDDIELQINPRIKLDYSMKIGCFENDLLKTEIEARRAKQKLTLAQARQTKANESSMRRSKKACRRNSPDGKQN